MYSIGLMLLPVTSLFFMYDRIYVEAIDREIPRYPTGKNFSRADTKIKVLLTFPFGAANCVVGNRVGGGNIAEKVRVQSSATRERSWCSCYLNNRARWDHSMSRHIEVKGAKRRSIVRWDLTGPTHPFLLRFWHLNSRCTCGFSACWTATWSFADSQCQTLKMVYKTQH